MKALMDNPQSRIMVEIAAILTTLLEVGESPRTPLYMALGHDYNHYMQVESILVNCKLVTISNNLVKLTETGKSKVMELSKLL